jgi:hypothetical protein
VTAPHFRALRAALIHFAKEFIGGHEEGIFLENSSDDHHGMCAHDVYRDARIHPIEILGENDCIRIIRQHVIEFRLVFDE